MSVAPVLAGDCTVSDQELAMTREEIRAFELMNQIRAARGLVPLQLHRPIVKAAAWKARYMHQNNYYSHVEKEPPFRGPGALMNDCGSSPSEWRGEIALGSCTTADCAVTGQWMHSPTHSQAIIDPKYRGVGIAQYGDAWVGEFTTTDVQPINPQIPAYVEMNGPLNGAVVAGVVTLQAAGWNKNGGPLTRIRFLLDGIEIAQANWPSLSASWDTRAAAGSNPRTLRVESVDGAVTGLMDPVALTIQNPPTAGDGLAAIYFDNENFTGPYAIRLDRQINFVWNDVSDPRPVLHRAPIVHPFLYAENWSARWTGKVGPTAAGEHTFFLTSCGGGRVWVNNMLVIDDWTDHTAREKAGAPVHLAAGSFPDIKVEYYYKNLGIANPAQISLSWQRAGQSKQVIPQARLFSIAGDESPVDATPPTPPRGLRVKS